jgi:tetratricopeptide (TPR) repeat protein
MSADQTPYDVFISYARKDNAPAARDAGDARGWVTAIRDHIAEEHRQFSTERLRLFFDTLEIKDADDWRFRILGALRRSRLLLVCLSPNYFASDYCRWEWEEYLQRQVHQLMGSESVATVYFVEVPGSDEQANARRLEELLRGNFTDLRPWFPEGAMALQKEEVGRRLARLGESLWERLQRARRATDAPGNLRWQNPHFVGRHEELRRLHEQLGTGAVGVVTAVHGLGGQGKTELAVAYAHGWADCYPAGLWSLAAEGKKELLPLIGELAWERALGFTPTAAEKADPALLGRGVLEHLKARAAAVEDAPSGRGAAALLLLDNVSEPDLLSPAQLATLPGGMGAHWLRIVATTRLDLREQKDRLALLAVDALDEESALRLIRDHQPPRDAQRRIVADFSEGQPEFASEAEEGAARQIVRALGGFTLAIEQVALYLGLHPEVAPSAFLATLTARGLPVADTLPQRDQDVAAQMHTQSKQLGVILDATLARLDAPARTALAFAALLPPDQVPWPWLRELTVAQHPDLAQTDELGADPWLAVRRRLTGLRLLTPGDHPEVARIHRLVAAHLKGASCVGSTSEWSASLQAALEAHLSARADAVSQESYVHSDWELDALLVAVPHWLTERPARDLAAIAVYLAGKIITYRTLAEAAAFLSPTHEVLATHAAEDPSNARWQRDLSVSHDRVGNLQVAQGDLAGALKSYRNSLAISARFAAADPSNAGWQQDLGVSHNKVGDVQLAQGGLEGALKSYRESLAIRTRLAVVDPSNASWQRDLSVSHERVGEVQLAQGDLAGALQCCRDSLVIRTRLAATDPSNAGWQRDLGISHEKIGDVQVAQGDLAGALKAHRDALAIAVRLAAVDPSNAGWQRDLSVSHERVGDVQRAQGDLAGALKPYRDSLTIRSRLAAADPSNADWQRGLSVSHEKIGDVQCAQGDLAGALKSHRDALAIRTRLAAADPSNAGWQRDLSVSRERLGDVQRAQGDLCGALKFYRDALAIHARLAAADPSNALWQRDLFVSYWKLADLAGKNGTDDAGDWWRKAYEQLSSMKARGIMLPTDERFLATLREKAGLGSGLSQWRRLVTSCWNAVDRICRLITNT